MIYIAGADRAADYRKMSLSFCTGQVFMRKKKVRFVFGFVACIIIAVAAFVGRGVFYGAATIHQLLAENRQLKQSLSNLTREDQIGYAKVILQEKREGKLYTTLRFVETARDDKLKTILEKEYTIEGDIVHFDALIVKFDDKLVADGKARALYLWRRIYGENIAPSEGLPIEELGVEPARYADLLETLAVKDRELFWSSIWDLSNDPQELSEHGIEAIYGNVVYSRLRPGLIYVFKIGATGHVYPEIVPDM